MNSEIYLQRTTADHADFQKLVIKLDKELAIRDGESHAFYHQFNKSKTLQHIVLAYSNKQVKACGALKHYSDKIVEIKRMFVQESDRGKGIASLVLKELENWAQELNYEKCILETGENQPEAINLYIKNNYSQIPNYGPYESIYTSVCFEKILSKIESS